MKKVSSPETDTGHLLIEHTNKTVETMEACFSFKEKKKYLRLRLSQFQLYYLQ